MYVVTTPLIYVDVQWLHTCDKTVSQSLGYLRRVTAGHRDYFAIERRAVFSSPLLSGFFINEICQFFLISAS